MFSVAGVTRHDLAPGAHTFSPSNLQSKSQDTDHVVFLETNMNARHWGGVGRHATGSSPTKRPTVRDGRAKAAQVPLARRQAREHESGGFALAHVLPHLHAVPRPDRPHASLSRSRPAAYQISSGPVQPTRAPPDAVLCCPPVLLVIGGPGPGCLNPRRARGTGDQFLAPPARPVGRTRTGRARGTRAHRRAACRAWLPACPRSSPPCE